MFEPIKRACDTAIKLNIAFLMKQLFMDGYFKAFIIDLNTNEQLYDKGIDANGIKLRSKFAKFGRYYSDHTIELKKIKGEPTDRVTLKDTGDFYHSFKLKLKDGAFVIDADTIKDDNDLIEVWGEDILGLTTESLNKIIELSIEILIPIIQKKILQ